jgi:hypothetical protein
MGLRPSPIDKCQQRSKFHDQQSDVDQFGQWKKTGTPYEQSVPFIPREGVVHADPKRLKHLHVEEINQIHNLNTETRITIT